MNIATWSALISMFFSAGGFRECLAGVEAWSLGLSVPWVLLSLRLRLVRVLECLIDGICF